MDLSPPLNSTLAPLFDTISLIRALLPSLILFLLVGTVHENIFQYMLSSVLRLGFMYTHL